MALQTTTNINIDFYDKKYILINAKQNDKNSRFISVTCYENGKLFTLNQTLHSVYIRYKKADEYGVLNSCEIDRGKIIVELTEQMLATSGMCYADLIVVEGGDAIVDENGAIINVEGSSILSTMTFCIDVSETAVDNSDIESNYDFDILNQTFEEYKTNYQNVVTMARSWAEGSTGLRDDENENNAKFWAEVAAKNAIGQISVVTGAKGDNEVSYRTGQVNITAENVGAIPTADIATLEEVRLELGI